MRPFIVPWHLLAVNFWMWVFSACTLFYLTLRWKRGFKSFLSHFTFCFVFWSLNSSPLPLQSVQFHINSWLPARSIVMETLAARQTIDPSGEILVLKKFCPVSWLFFFTSSNILYDMNLIHLKIWIVSNNCDMFRNYGLKLEHLCWPPSWLLSNYVVKYSRAFFMQTLEKIHLAETRFLIHL